MRKIAFSLLVLAVCLSAADFWQRVQATPALQRQHLAAVVHLCGAGAAALYAQRGFSFLPGERCGDHDPRVYLAQVDALGAWFARLARAEDLERGG